MPWHKRVAKLPDVHVSALTERENHVRPLLQRKQLDEPHHNVTDLDGTYWHPWCVAHYTVAYL